MSSSNSCSTADTNWKKVVWPAVPPRTSSNSISVSAQHVIHHQQTLQQDSHPVDHPLSWIGSQQSAGRVEQIEHEMEMDIQKKTFDIQNRSRSRHRSGRSGVAERAKSFERNTSNPPRSRSGSFSRNPSGSRQQLEHQWNSRPSSRMDGGETFETPKRWASIGKINTSQWEDRIRAESPVVEKTPPVKRKQFTQFSQQQKQTVEKKDVKKVQELNSVYIQSLHNEFENKEDIVEEWVRQTTQHQEEHHQEVHRQHRNELERLSYDIAENVVARMEQEQQQNSRINYGATSSTSSSKVQQESSHHGVFRATPAEVQVDTDRRIRQHEESLKRKEKEKKLQEQEIKRQEMEMKKREKEMKKREIELLQKQKKQNEELIKQEEAKLVKFQQQQKLEQQRNVHQQKMEQQRMEQQRMEKQRMEQRMDQQRMEQQRMEHKRIEQHIIEQQRMEQQRMEHQRMEQQRMEHQRMEQQRMEQQRMEQQRMEQQRMEQQRMEQQRMEQQRIEQQKREKQRMEHQRTEHNQRESRKINHGNFEPENRSITPTPFINRSEDLKNIKTGQVHEKRDFFIRSASTDRLQRVGLSPGPRRRQVNNWIKNDPEENTSRPGSSMGQVADQSNGNVKSVISNWGLSKSKSSAAVLEDRPGSRTGSRSRFMRNNQWNQQPRERSETPTRFIVDTHHVQEVANEWGKENQSVNSGRITPSRTIGDSFADSKISSRNKPQTAAAWRNQNKDPPSIKLVNVSVERNDSNIHISENASAQMASYIQNESKQSSIVTTTSAVSSNQDVSTSTVVDKVELPPKSPAPIRSNQQSKAKMEQRFGNIQQVRKEESQYHQESSKMMHKVSEEHISESHQSKEEQQKATVTKKYRNESYKKESGQIYEQESKASKGEGLPMPVSQSWYDPSNISKNSSTSTIAHLDGLTSPTGTGKTPLPVLAGWFDEEQQKKKTTNGAAKEIRRNVEVPKVAPPAPPPPPPQQSGKVSPTKKKVEFVEPEPDSCSSTSTYEDARDDELKIEELPSDENVDEETAMKGKVKGNIAKFQKGFQQTKVNKQPEEDEGFRGKVKLNKHNYLSKTSSTSADREENERIMRSRELQEIAKARSQMNWEHKEDEETQLSEKDKRNLELNQIKNLRSGSKWDHHDHVEDERPSSKTPDPDLIEARNNIRNTSAVWQQREEHQQQQQQLQRTPIPSRRIGNLFNKSSDQWDDDDDDFPAPPPDQPPVSDVEDVEDFNQPPPPPRDSSRGYMMGYKQK